MPDAFDSPTPPESRNVCWLVSRRIKARDYQIVDFKPGNRLHYATANRRHENILNIGLELEAGTLIALANWLRPISLKPGIETKILALISDILEFRSYRKNRVSPARRCFYGW